MLVAEVPTVALVFRPFPLGCTHSGPPNDTKFAARA
jgi:hypothetical protein